MGCTCTFFLIKSYTNKSVHKEIKDRIQYIIESKQKNIQLTVKKTISAWGGFFMMCQ
jgi:hypothetical protein